MQGRKIEHEYAGYTRGMARKEQVISRLRTGYTRATHGATEQTKRKMMMTPKIWTRGALGMKKIMECTKKIGFYDGI
jgi:hypothetical protein